MTPSNASSSTSTASTPDTTHSNSTHTPVAALSVSQADNEAPESVQNTPITPLAGSSIPSPHTTHGTGANTSAEDGPSAPTPESRTSDDHPDDEEYVWVDPVPEYTPPPPPHPSLADHPPTPSPLVIPPPRAHRTKDAQYAAYYEALVTNLAAHDLLGVLAPGPLPYPSRHLLSPALAILRAVVGVHFPTLHWDGVTSDAWLVDLRGGPRSVAYSFELYSKAVDTWFARVCGLFLCWLLLTTRTCDSLFGQGYDFVGNGQQPRPRTWLLSSLH